MTTPPHQEWEHLLRRPPEVHPPPALVRRVRARTAHFRIRSRRMVWHWALGYALALVMSGFPWLLLTWLVFPPAAQAWVRRWVLWQWALPMLWETLREGLTSTWWMPLLALGLTTVIGAYLWGRWVVGIWQRQQGHGPPETLRIPR